MKQFGFNIAPIMRKEFRQIRRDRRALGMLIFLPAFMLIMIGYALNFDVKHLSIAVYDEDRSPVSRAFVEAITQSEYMELGGYIDRSSDADALLEQGTAHMVLVIPRGFSADLAHNRETPVQVLIDGANSNTAAIAHGYISLAMQEYSVRIVADWMERRGRTFTYPLTLQPKLWYNPELKSAKFLVPGLFGLILMIVTVISTSLSIVREKESGTMEQLKTSPLFSNEIILGKT
ncbi:MAG: ABC transporter permease, partial [Bacteroidota bacterium]